jgi:Tfp pilus assembly protein PilV
MAKHRSPPYSNGVSLIEALVALAVMAFGMLSLVGVQATMRLNSDLSKQRTEATRIATEELEGLRLFTSVPVASGQTSWDGIASRTLSAYVPPSSIGNTSYRVERTVDQATTTQKVVTVEVSWVDRAGGAQSVTIDTVLVAAAPALSALLSVPPLPSPTSQINGRNATIPHDAVNQGDGSSLFHPPGASDVSWYFNNITGLICIGGATCAAPMSLVSGSVNFDRRPLPSSENPTGPAINLGSGPRSMAGPLLAPQNIASTTPTQPQCYADIADSRPYVNYLCAVRAGSNAGWGGQLNMNSTLTKSDGTVLTLGTGAGQYRVCRYTPALGDFTSNTDHPRTYCLTTPPPDPLTDAYTACLATRVKANLINQNFLVIDGVATCPADDDTTPLVNGNTVRHQP